MWNTEENKIIDLAEHSWQTQTPVKATETLDNLPKEVTDFQQKFSGEILEVVELANDPRFNWVPFKDAVATILWGGKFDPAKLADNISNIRDENTQYDKAA